jgi:hypothetical protein
MVERKSVIQVALPPLSSRLYRPDPAPAYRLRFDGAKSACLDGSNATFEEIADRRSSSPPRHDVGDAKHENG